MTPKNQPEFAGRDEPPAGEDLLPPAEAASTRVRAPEVDEFLAGLAPADFEAGEVLIPNTYRQTDAVDHVARLAFVRFGLVQGAWHHSTLAPQHRAAAVVAGDGRWIGLDALKFGENLFRYTALAPTRAHVVPLADLMQGAPAPVVFDVLESVSLAWCTSASLLSLSAAPLDLRVLLLLFDVSRLHPRPDLDLPQRVVAELVGVSRQALNPVLKDLERRGLIELGYSQIVVRDPTRLIEEIRRAARATART